ncbi:unnamed protein product [Closterium sp. Yama58-4]|nr:unnamed protein product [Closterium sp. Yama58-4]
MATTDRRPAFSRRSRSHHKSPSTDSFLADSLSRFVETLAENDPSYSSLPPRHSPRSTLSPMSSSSSTPSAMRTGRRSLEIPSDADSSHGFASPRDVPRRLAMRLLVGDSGGAVDAATTRVRTPEKGVPRGSSGRCSVNAPGTYNRDLLNGDFSREFCLQAEAGREGPQGRNGGSRAMFRSISEHVGPDTTTPFSPASPASLASSASTPNGVQRTASPKGRYLSRVGASEPLERTLPRKSRLNGDEETDAGSTATGRDGTDAEEGDSSDASVSMRRLGREMNELRRQLERCSKINKWLTESLRSAERIAAEATAAAKVAEAERDHVAKELEEMLNAWSQADNAAAAKQEEERSSVERSRASLERARAVLAQEREAVGREREEVKREREELKREREALQKDKERIAAGRAAQEVHMEWSKAHRQAEMMGVRQHQHHVTPDGVLLRSVSMNSTCSTCSTCSCLSSTRCINDARRLAMRLLVGDRGGAVDAATPRVRTPEKGASQGTSGTRGAESGIQNREPKSRDNWSREFPLEAADAGREGPQSRKHGGAKAMIRSISDRVARDSVGPNATIPTSPTSSTSSASSASSASSIKAIQLNASRVAASDPLERTLPRKARLKDDDTAAAVRNEATDGEEDSDAGSVSMRRLRREIDDLRTQLERCVRINKLLSESLRSAERTANEATAAARVLASERDDLAKELEAVLKAWSQADDEREAVGREKEEVRKEREELKREREALQKDKERISKDAAKLAAREVQSERMKVQQQAWMMGVRQHQHHVTPDGVLVRSASMSSTCNCLNSTKTRSNDEEATDQEPSKPGGRRSSGSIKVGESASRRIPSCRSESNLSACASRAQEHAPTGLPHSASAGMQSAAGWEVYPSHQIREKAHKVGRMAAYVRERWESPAVPHALACRAEPFTEAACDLSLEADFLASVEGAKKLNPVLARPYQLVLYGLYKQATAGSITLCSEDDVDTDDQEKLQAWRDFAGLSIEVAMVNYVQKVKQFQMLFSPST